MIQCNVEPFALFGQQGQVKLILRDSIIELIRQWRIQQARRWGIIVGFKGGIKICLTWGLTGFPILNILAIGR